MRRIILESPLAADTVEGRARNLVYGRACVRDALIQGNSPIAPHLLWGNPDGKVLNDCIPTERQYGLEAASWWYHPDVVDAIVAYCDLHISKGMALGIQRGMDVGIPIQYRTIGWTPDV
jgi:hypothetical protein